MRTLGAMLMVLMVAGSAAGSGEQVDAKATKALIAHLQGFAGASWLQVVEGVAVVTAPKGKIARVQTSIYRDTEGKLVARTICRAVMQANGIEAARVLGRDKTTLASGSLDTVRAGLAVSGPASCR